MTEEGSTCPMERTLAMRSKKKRGVWKYVRQHPWLYLLMLPGIVYLFIFNYIPMYGVVIAFEKFNFVKGIFGSKWIGLENFRDLFGSDQFFRVFRNSLEFSLLRLLFSFPMPIILALLLNEVRQMKYKKLIQTIVYVPHFISWVVVASLVINLLLPTKQGAVNTVMSWFGVMPRNYLTSSAHFRGIVIAAEIWKGAGWGTIVYLSALSQVDPQIYEAAYIDGANRWQIMFRITLPGILSTVSVMLILRIGSLMNNGFEQIYLLYSPMVYDVADVFETYTYRIGIQGGKYSYSTAVGLFQSVVGFILIMVSNYASRRLSESSLF